MSIFSSQETNEKRQPSRCLVSGIILLDLLRELKKEEFEGIGKEERFGHIMDCDRRIEEFMADEAKKMGISEGYDTKF